MSHRKEISREEIMVAYVEQADATLKSAAKQLGCTDAVLTRCMREHGIPAKKNTRSWHRRCQWPQLRDPEWLKAEAASKTASEIAANLGAAAPNVLHAFRKFGIQSAISKGEQQLRKAKERADRHRPSEEAIRSAYFRSPDVTVMEAARELGVSYAYLVNTMRFYGIQAKSKTRNPRKSAIPQLQDRDWLEDQLKTKTFAQIAKELGTTRGNVADKAYRWDIASRSTTMSRAVSESIHDRFPDGRRAEDAPNWKGGRRVVRHRKDDSRGLYIYVFMPQHPNATKDGYVMEHRLVAEQKIGRYLLPGEDVHHVNGDTMDNRSENLEVLSREAHSRRHFDAVKELEKYKERYGLLADESPTEDHEIT